MSDEKTIIQSSESAKIGEKKLVSEKKENNGKSKKKILEKESERFDEVAIAEKESAYHRILGKIKKTAGKSNQDEESIVMDAKKISKQVDAESQINSLVDLATNKSVVYAIKVAKHLDDNYVLDRLHDSLLVDKLRKMLIEKGLIKEY